MVLPHTQIRALSLPQISGHSLTGKASLSLRSKGSRSTLKFPNTGVLGSRGGLQKTGDLGSSMAIANGHQDTDR